jgi:hypothetical protein
MRIHGLLAPGLVLAIALGTAGASLDAQELRCDSDELSGSDYDHAMAAIKSVLPGGATIDSQLWICRNPERATASVETKHKNNPLGFHQWWLLTCSREHKPWSCDKPDEVRELRIPVQFLGTARSATIQFGSDQSAAEAREVATQVYARLQPGADPPQACEVGQTAQDWARKAQDYRQTTSELRATLNVLDQQILVELSDWSGLAFVFEPDTPSAGHATLKCWSEFVVVT